MLDTLKPLATLLVAALLAASLATAAQAQGVLMPREAAIGPLSVKYQRVNVDVREGTSVTKVEQVFVNHTRRPLEATYLFPVPDGAAITDFRLMINGKMQKGEVLDKGKAERIYTDIVRRLKDPGIVDWIKPTLFRARVFPVPPGGEQKFSLTYSQVLPFASGTYKLTYPLRTAAQKAVRTLQDFTLTVNLQHSVPIKSVYSPTHRVAVARKGEHRATVGFEGDRVALDRDFLLYFGVSKERVGMSLLTHRKPGEPGYFLLTAAPKNTFDRQEVQGKAVTFVLDTSGSMNGKKMAHAKKALQWSLNRLGSDDRFNVIRFSSDVELLSPELLVANKANVTRATSFVAGFEAAGGTAIDDALRAAFEINSGTKTRHMIVFITDGKPTIGETSLKRILHNAKTANTRQARVFPFGVGEQINAHLLDKLALGHHGRTQYVKPNEDIEVAVSGLYNTIAYPVLSDVTLELRGVRAFAMLPQAPGDLFKGQQLLVVGRYRGNGHKLVRLAGKLGAAAQRYDFEGSFPADNSDNAFIAQLWAYRQVGFLLDQVRLNGETPELRQEIVQLAKRFGIVTPYTSYLVLEDTAVSGDLRRPRPPRRPMLMRRPGSKGRSFGGAGDNAAPSPTAAEQEATETAKKSGEFRKQDGKAGVRTAKTLKRMKEKTQAGSTVGAVRHASGRAFHFKSGAWRDTMFKPAMKTLEIAPYSDAWLRIAALNPTLRAAMALGERVVIVVRGRALLIAPGGKTTVTASDVRPFKR